MSVEDRDPGALYEQEHVHEVYNKIASHFSSTRFKPWPVVDNFLHSLRVGSVGLDVGCGNGKYLTVRKDVFIVASDRSTELLKFATQHQPHSAVVADSLYLPHPCLMFDFAICIAVIHHLSTASRRQDAIKAILSTLKNSPKPSQPTHGVSDRKKSAKGQALIFVWALEQKGSRRGWDVGHEQDVLVPWVLKSDSSNSNSRRKRNESSMIEGEPSAGKVPLCGSNEIPVKPEQEQDQRSQTFQRYYHLYREGELENDIIAAGGRVVRTGYDRDNWWAVCERYD